MLYLRSCGARRGNTCGMPLHTPPQLRSLTESPRQRWPQTSPRLPVGVAPNFARELIREEVWRLWPAYDTRRKKRHISIQNNSFVAMSFSLCHRPNVNECYRISPMSTNVCECHRMFIECHRPNVNECYRILPNVNECPEHSINIFKTH